MSWCTDQSLSGLFVALHLGLLLSPAIAHGQEVPSKEGEAAPSEAMGSSEAAAPSEAAARSEAAAPNEAAVPSEVPSEGEEPPASEPFRIQTAAHLPEWFELGGSFRARYGFLHNQFRPGLDRDDMALSLRTLVQAGLHFDPVSFVGEFQDSRAYLDDENSGISTIVVNSVAFLQGYAGLNVGSADKGAGAFDVRLGRQTIDLGSRRFIARNRYRDTIQNYNGATVFWEREKTSMMGFFVLPVTVKPENSDPEALQENRVEFDRERFGLRLFGLHAVQKEVVAGINAEAFVYALQEEDNSNNETPDRKLYTEGIRLLREPETGSLDFEAEGVLQVGKRSASADPNATEQNVLAHFAHGELGYSFDAPWAPRVSAEIDYGSGDNPNNADTYSRFDSLFGPRRAEFGPTGIYGLLARENIVSQGARAEIKPSDRFDAFVSWRANWLPQPGDRFARTVADPTGDSGNFAGHQVEVRTRTWILPKNLLWELGAAAFINGEFLRDAPMATGYGNSLFGYTDLAFLF